MLTAAFSLYWLPTLEASRLDGTREVWRLKLRSSTDTGVFDTVSGREVTSVPGYLSSMFADPLDLPTTFTKRPSFTSSTTPGSEETRLSASIEVSTAV